MDKEYTYYLQNIEPFNKIQYDDSMTREKYVENFNRLKDMSRYRYCNVHGLLGVFIATNMDKEFIAVCTPHDNEIGAPFRCPEYLISKGTIITTPYMPSIKHNEIFKNNILTEYITGVYIKKGTKLKSV